ncbi:2-dehydro-3-deoxy-6-phosphogalactonate aldolase [Sphingomonas glacialis]|uniref:2-dehydro-3-deoxy-6-phosphogalactonate aldolase n=1 Tax=Sphingomonas glacialis TaxID=658225 RepID=A0ABQ3LX14_9SPHN|nr:2-dehydro-3-deoxy-6-phosphogalactonate aldolase [Sphingomonas glacialis]GHH26836.1 2-dehydro-3-deoxy-6-phosphogalactonate aldolase [Sphingomonas glacialis]
MDTDTLLTTALERCPLVAILRGVKPSEVEGIVDAVLSAGIHIVEVPLNSPDPFDSIARLVQRFGDDALIGAGTVLSVANARRVAEVGARLVISPNVDVEVIAETQRLGLVSLPGYFTPSEAFAAINAGANGLKLFPAEAATPKILNAQRAVIPRSVPILAVGGITPITMCEWRGSCEGFGLGSALYKTGMDAEQVGRNATDFVSAVNRYREEPSS